MLRPDPFPPVFGLYDNPGSVTLTEAEQVFKMLEKNRLEMARKELLYGVAFNGARGIDLDNLGRTPLEASRQDYSGLLSNVESSTIQDLLSAFQPAKDELLADLRGLHPEIADKLSNDSFLATNIYLNPHKPTDTDRSSSLNSFPYQLFYEPNGTNDLMIGMDQEDYMYGNKGNDVLIGEGGDDVLVGGEGNDVLYGGAGNDYFFGGKGNDTMYGGADDDVYFIDPGDGEDTIEDKQGKNKVMFCGEEINFFYQDGDGYVSISGNLTASIVDGHFDVTDGNGTTVRLNEEFQWGDFGTTLIDLPDDNVLCYTSPIRLCEGKQSHEIAASSRQSGTPRNDCFSNIV